MERKDLNIILDSAVNWLMYKDMTVLITGSTGRLGRYIVDTLIEIDIHYNLNMRVLCAARSQEKLKEVFGNEQEYPNMEVLCQDVNDPIVYSGRIDYIFHTAGPGAPVDFNENPHGTLWTHINGTHNILECARTHGTKKVFYFSTVEIYGEWKEERGIMESDMGILRHLNSRACCPEAKRLCETMLAVYKQQYGVGYCGVRLSHTLGPGILLDDGRAFAEFIDCSLKGEDIVLHSDGSAMRTYTYVADVINIVFLIMEKGEETFYNVSAEENLISIRDLAELIANLSPSGKTKVRLSDEAAKMPYLPFKLPIMDTSKVRDLGWRPKVGLRDMFKWTMEALV